MNIRRPITIEFTGTPNSGKTTLLKILPELLTSMGISVEVMQEDAEVVPTSIPKKTWARNVWITYGQLQSLLETKFSQADIIFLDRGFYDAIFWAQFLYAQGVCSFEESNSLQKLLKEMDCQFSFHPDYLFVFDISSEESLRRRHAQSNEPTVMSTTDFLDLYKQQLDQFCKGVFSPIYRLDTTNLSILEMQENLLKEISKILCLN